MQKGENSGAKVVWSWAFPLQGKAAGALRREYRAQVPLLPLLVESERPIDPIPGRKKKKSVVPAVLGTAVIIFRLSFGRG